MDEARKKKLIWQLPFLTLLIVGTILIIRQQHVMPYQKNAGLIFGTTYNITYQSDEDLHKEVLERYGKLGLKPYGGFLNPDIVPVKKGNKVVDYEVVYKTGFVDQQLDYTHHYGTLQ